MKSSWSGNPSGVLRGLTLSPMHRSLLVVSAVCAILYGLRPALPKIPGMFAVKGGAVFCLALLAFNILRDASGRILGAALLLSSAGDVFLALPEDRYFVHGLGSFLAAHLLYLFLFVRFRSRARPLEIQHGLGAGLLALYSGSLGAWLYPTLGELELPVAVYILALTAMAISALFARFDSRWVAAGALLFVLSDSLIGITRFRMPVPGGDLLIWGSYYVAQYLIVGGFLGMRIRRR